MVLHNLIWFKFLLIPSVRRESLWSFSAMINFNHANVVNAAKLTPEIASMPVNWRSRTLHNQPQIH